MISSPRSRAASESFTQVELTWIEGKLERWIRFGQVVDEKIIDRQRRILSFAPNSIFAFVRWASNDFGTIISRIDIARAVVAGEPFQTLPFVSPGGEVLLRVSGWRRVEQVHQAIDGIETLGVDPVAAAPEYWRHLHNRIAASEEPRAYNLLQHRVWLLRRGLL